MIVSSVYFWLEQIRSRTEQYDCNTLEQRRLCSYRVGEDEVPLRRSRSAMELRWESDEGVRERIRKWEAQSAIPAVDQTSKDQSSKPEAGSDQCGIPEVLRLSQHEHPEEPQKHPQKRRTTAQLRAGKSLDSILESINEEADLEEVELRNKRHTLSSVADYCDRRKAYLHKGRSLESLFESFVELRNNRRSVDLSERRKAMNKRRSSLLMLETINENSDQLVRGPYMHVWECRTLEVKHGFEARTSVVFDETVEELPVESEVRVKFLPSLPTDVIYWLNELMTSCECEEDEEVESYTQLTAYGSPKESKFQTLNYTESIKRRQTLGSPEALPSYLERCNKITVDGKAFKINKSDTLRVEMDNLYLYDDRGNKKIIVRNFSMFRKESETSKEILFLYGGSQMKVTKEKESTMVVEKRSLLQKFLRKRMSQEDLEKKGIYMDEPIFGNKLDLLAEKYKTDVPEFVSRTARLIELPQNIVSQGIYRASGNIATIQKIRLKVDSNKLSVLEEHKTDTDVLAGALKMFFRELKKSLIDRKEYEELVKIVGSKLSDDKKYHAVGKVISTLSRPHKETLEFLMGHLLRVTQYEKENHMSIQSMAICWGPSIVCFEDVIVNREQILELAQMKNSIVELLMYTYKSTMKCNLEPSDSMMSLQSSSSEYSPSPRELTRSLSADHFQFKSSSYQNLSVTFDDRFAEQLTEMIERDSSGAYRQPGNLKLAEKIWSKSKKRSSKTIKSLLRKATTCDLCEVLKMCYDELRSRPILPHYMFDDFIRLTDECIGNDEELYGKIRSSVNILPWSSQHVQLFKHFNRIVSNQGAFKSSDIAKFWCDLLTSRQLDSKVDLTIANVIEAYSPKYDDLQPPVEETKEKRRVSLYDNVVGYDGNNLGSKHLGHISEENLEETSKICCRGGDRPETSIYSKSDDS